MANPISALEHRPSDFIREVSIDAIYFYANELSGLYLPDDFRQANADVFKVQYWNPEDRLCGKFGRFALQLVEEDEQTELDDILVMGTIVGLHGVNLNRDMESLRHSNLQDRVRGFLKERDMSGKQIMVDQADYGATSIKLDESGTPQSVNVSGYSFDFGRANTEGRLRTCELFERLLGDSVSVINVDPEPEEHDRIVR